MTVYLAHPIDHTNGATVKQHLPMISLICKQAGATAVFIPGQAWNHVNTQTTSTIQRVNLSVIESSNIVVAYWPAGVETMGVPLEVAHACQHAIPVVVIRGDGSTPISLQPYNPVMVPENDITSGNGGQLLQAVGALLELPRDIQDDRSLRSMTARFDGEGTQPETALAGDAGFDISYHGDDDITIWPNEVARVPSGISYQMPKGYWSLILGRSSTFSKRNLFVPPSVIDAGYTGDIFAICWNIGAVAEIIKPGDRLAQIIPMPLSAEFMQWAHGPLADTARGAAGFGSTGN